MTAARKLMDPDEFLIWALDQEESYELVDGKPVLKFDNGPEMMSGGTRRHADVTQNIYTALRTRLRGGQCRAFLGDLFAVRTSIRKHRRPDVFVDCGEGSGRDLEAVEPSVLFEVLSASSARDDLFIKPEEYKRLSTVTSYIVVDLDAALLKVWTRDEEGRWSDGVVAGIDQVLSLPTLAVLLPLSEIYEGVSFDLQA